MMDLTSLGTDNSQFIVW